MAEALTRGVKAMYFLTTSAEKLFARFGFKRLARDEVPAASAAGLRKPDDSRAGPSWEPTSARPGV